MSPAIHASIADALLGGGSVALVAARHGVPSLAVCAIRDRLKRKATRKRPRLIKAAGC